MGWLEPGPHWDGGDRAEPQWLAVSSLARGQIFLKKYLFIIYLFIWLLRVFVVAYAIFSLPCGVQTLTCGMWDLVP